MTSAATLPASPPTDALPGLLPHHLKELRASGLSDPTIKAAGIYSETSHAKIVSLLNVKRWNRKAGPAMVFPFYDEDGNVVLYRVKPDHPPLQKGKPAKYLSPTGSTVRGYIPPAARPALENPTARLFVTEGEKKANKGTQEGFPCIGLTGVDCWHPAKSSALLPDLERITWKGRLTYIVFDSDAADNRNVTDNETLLAAALIARGATVKIVRLPQGPLNGDGTPAKVGLDDYLVAHGPGEFEKLLAAAEEPAPPEPGSCKLPAKDADPFHAAAGILEAERQDDVLTLRFWRGAFYAWRAGAYREVQKEEVRARVLGALNCDYSGIGQYFVGNVLDQLKAQSLLDGRTEAPEWLTEPPTFSDDKSYWPADGVLVARNGLVCLPRLVEGRECFHPPTPRFFSTAALDYEFGTDAARPGLWLDFLSQLWPDDRQSTDTLQEWFGYTLTQDTRQQKIILLIGPKRSGKGTIARVQRALIGPENTAGPTLSSLATNFGLWPLLGKSLAIIPDARLSHRIESSIVVERLLSISGEDALTIDRKCLEPVTCKLPTRLMILTNELPRLTDSSGALAGRMIVLRLTQSWFGREDRMLFDKLQPELPGILLWAIEGWRRLEERGHFEQPTAAECLQQEMEDLSSPIRVFVRERCVVGAGYRVAVDDLYSAWKAWCDARGPREPGTEQTFGRDLLAAVPTLRRTRPQEGGERYRAYEGIALRG